MSNLGRLRSEDGEWYLIPVEELDEFDALQQEIEDSDAYDSHWYDLVDKFNEKYRKYKLEGDMYDVDVILPEDP